MDHTRSHMTTKKRDKSYREHLSCAGREMPKPHMRKGSEGGKSAWSKELGRDATHSKD